MEIYALLAQPFLRLRKMAATHEEVSGNLILTANHPSPLSALRGPAPLMGCRHFSKAQNWLSEQGIAFDWELDK